MAVEIPNDPDELPTSKRRYVGSGVRRLEDPALLTGRTEFIDDVELPACSTARSCAAPWRNARMTNIDRRRRGRASFPVSSRSSRAKTQLTMELSSE